MFLIVLVLLRNTASHAQSLEGSRFGLYAACPRYSFRGAIWLKDVATGGSRESPSVMYLLSTRSVGLGFGDHRQSCGSAGCIPGSRLLSMGLGRGSYWARNLQGWPGARQSGSPPGAGSFGSLAPPFRTRARFSRRAKILPVILTTPTLESNDGYV